MATEIDAAQATHVQVVCLCAQWCGVCRDYRATFEALAGRLGSSMRIDSAWVDVEDQADVIEPLDIDNFPTLLLAVRGQARFLGPVLPQAATLERMLQSALACGSSRVLPEAQALLARLQAAGLLDLCAAGNALKL